MARPLRPPQPGSWFHVTVRGNNKQPIFTDDQDRHSFLGLLGAASQRQQVLVHAFCLMTNHYHLLVRDEVGELSKALQHVNGVYAQRFNRRHSRVGHLFQGRFGSSQIHDDAYLVVCAAYIHRNPVVAGLVESPDRFPWSSYGAYLDVARRPLWLVTKDLLALHGDAVGDLVRFTEHSTIDDELVEHTQNRATRLRAVEGFGDPEAAGSRIDELRPIVSLTEIDAAVAEVFGSTGAEASSRVRSDARAVALFVAHRYQGFSLRAIGAHHGISTSRVSRLTMMLEERRRDDATVARRVDETVRVLGTTGGLARLSTRSTVA